MASSAMAAGSLDLQVVEGLAKKRGERFAFDCYRRLLDMFGDVVLNIEHEKFEEQIHAVKVRGRAGAHSGHGCHQLGLVGVGMEPAEHQIPIPPGLCMPSPSSMHTFCNADTHPNAP